jgi:hemerythrin
MKVNQLIDDIVQKGDYQREKIISTIMFLKEYAVTHFKDEEEYQLSINDPNYTEHKKMHDDFITTVLKHERNMINSDFAHKDVSKFTGTLFAWLIYHVSDTDQKIGKTAGEPPENNDYKEIICECFCDVLSNMIETDKTAIKKVVQHSENFDGSIAVRHTFKRLIDGYVIFDYSVAFINKMMYFLTEISPDENEIDDFEKTFLLQISTMTIENVCRRLHIDEHTLNESDIFVAEKSDSPVKEKIAFDTGLGIVEVGFHGNF